MNIEGESARRTFYLLLFRRRSLLAEWALNMCTIRTNQINRLHPHLDLETTIFLFMW